MNSFFKMRALERQKDTPAGMVPVEIIATTGTEKRIFVILDLSDSCRSVAPTLKKLSWLWQRIPPHWQVTIFALSNSEPLHPVSGSMFSRDLGAFLCDLETNHQWGQWINHQAKRGSFFRPTLDGIERFFSSQRETDSTRPTEAIAIILTDGELLDPDPVQVPGWLACVGLLYQEKKSKAPSWRKVLTGTPLLEFESTEIESLITGMICPAMNVWEIAPSFDCSVINSDMTRSYKRAPFMWNFANGPLTLLVEAADIGTSDKFLDARLKKEKTRLDFSKISPENLFPGGEPISATIANKGLGIIDDPRVVQQIIADLKKSAVNRESLSENCITLIMSRFKESPKFENAIVVTVPTDSTQPLILVGKLFKAPNGFLFLRGANDAPQDPGFAPRLDLRVEYKQDDARWYLMHGDKRTELAPRGCGLLSNVFFDSKGTECEAFYTGPLVK